ncbi:MAG TPA: hypothetical protein VFQ61_24520 [Polyangiaceae bacterium]|nr:hypothetical protein [Polyangiaceae bacterium]
MTRQTSFAGWLPVGCIALGLLLSACSSEDLTDAAQPAGSGGNAAPGSSGAASGGASNSGGSGGVSGSPAADAVARLLPRDARLVSLYEPPLNFSATALAFDPLRPGELWVTLRRFPTGAPCTEQDPTGCAALRGQVTLLVGATGPNPMAEQRRDGNAWHFMRRPTSIAFGDNGNLATCGEARTDNYEDEVIDYSGPTLWSSDPSIFGATPQADQNGTHLDMLHSTPYCMGIEHERGNIYFTFNGKLGAIDRYDFKEPHQIGGEDHSDGELYRYAEGEFTRAPEIPSHLALDRERQMLYVADTGNGRVARLDITSGSMGDDVETNDPIHVHVSMVGAIVDTFVKGAPLTAPSGVVVVSSNVFVTDNATSRIHAFDPQGHELASMETGLPSGSLAGIAIGPDERLYLADLKNGRAYRVESSTGAGGAD